MGNNQRKKLAAIQFNQNREKQALFAADRRRKRIEFEKTSEGKRKAREARMLLAVCAGLSATYEI